MILTITKYHKTLLRDSRAFAFYSKIFVFFRNQDDSKNTKWNLFKNHPIYIYSQWMLWQFLPLFLIFHEKYAFCHFCSIWCAPWGMGYQIPDQFALHILALKQSTRLSLGSICIFLLIECEISYFGPIWSSPCATPQPHNQKNGDYASKSLRVTPTNW